MNGADALIDKLTEADFVLADKAYDACKRMRNKLEKNSCIAVIPPKKNRKIQFIYGTVNKII